ncbi:MAG: 4-(cytidine 5'-diphospho)-2-C-methyl-D-erythritol kinase [Bacillota bacterium]
MREIELKSRAKINLTLDVVGKREDGYHLLETVMQSLKLHDRIIMSKLDVDEIQIKSNLPWLPCDERNLAHKGVKLMKERFQIKEGVHISMSKRIPVSAGLGGGSSNCAAAMVGMNRLFSLGLRRFELEKLAAEIGSDIPYCIRRGTVLGTGIGTELKNITPCPSCFVVLAKMPVSVSTVTVYKGLDLNQISEHPSAKKMEKAMQSKDIVAMGQALGNVLESVTMERFPRIKDMKETFIELGAKGALMSGSGPTVFALFESYEEARQVANTVKRQYGLKEVFVTETFQELSYQQRMTKGGNAYE